MRGPFGSHATQGARVTRLLLYINRRSGVAHVDRRCDAIASVPARYLRLELYDPARPRRMCSRCWDGGRPRRSAFAGAAASVTERSEGNLRSGLTGADAAATTATKRAAAGRALGRLAVPEEQHCAYSEGREGNEDCNGIGPAWMRIEVTRRAAACVARAVGIVEDGGELRRGVPVQPHRRGNSCAGDQEGGEYSEPLHASRSWHGLRSKSRPPIEVGSSNTRPTARTGTAQDMGWAHHSELRVFRGYVVNRWTGEVLSSVVADVGRERG
jgi:hypothetical protein